MSMTATTIDDRALQLEQAGSARIVARAASRDEWDALMLASAHPHLPQAFAYGEARAAGGKWRSVRIVFEQAGQPVAFATVLQLRRFGLTLLNRVNRGPVFVDGAPSDALVSGVYRELRRRWGRVWTAPLLIAPALEMGERADKLLRAAGYMRRTPQSWLSARIDLTRDESAILAGFASTFRNRLRAAEKAGAQLEVSETADAFDWMIERHLQNMDDKGFSALGRPALEALRATAPENVLVFRLIHEGQPVAGMSVVRFGRVAEYHVGWFGPEGRKLNAGNFLMWNIMRELKRRGVASFDVGGMKYGDGYTRFKKTMNPVEYELAGEWMSL
jgi:hypothetical protein